MYCPHFFVTFTLGESTSIRKNSNLFVFSLTYSYLCSQIITKNEYSLIVLLLGICLEISYSLYRFKILDRSTAIVFMFIFSLFIILLLSIFRYFKSIKNNINIHKMELDATIVDLIKNPNFNKEVYVPLLEYKVKSEYFEFNYVSDDPKYLPKIGDTVKIYVNPNDYYDVYIPPSKRAIIKGLASTIFIMIVSLLLLIDLKANKE